MQMLIEMTGYASSVIAIKLKKSIIFYSHVLFYRDLRKPYITRYYYQWPTLDKFDNLMSKTNRTIVINLA